MSLYNSYTGADAWGEASEETVRKLNAEFVRRIEAAFPGLQIVETRNPHSVGVSGPRGELRRRLRLNLKLGNSGTSTRRETRMNSRILLMTQVLNFQGDEMRLRISVFYSPATGSFERQVRETLMVIKYNWQEESYAFHELLEQSLMSDPRLN